ncbi:hypothetical protein Goshw_022344 [Gossypium schwendimanii]|uniref:FLZ-type domain-containing protein n=1 Tax=Gossypium schwendimanii TaxID=34291 RepID=A0A7J9N2M2_GOSSC|nr:hypothetical protein [Gossypium schwendimanii]
MAVKLNSSPFKVEETSNPMPRDTANLSNKIRSCSSVVVGLRILTQTSLVKSNVMVVKPAFKISLPGSRNHHLLRSPADDSFFLKSCHLCRKNLSLDKEVYMYRGDQGFCSIKCREKQILMDETRELEQSTEQRIGKGGHCRHCSPAASARREVHLLLEDLRRRNQSSTHESQKPWAIVS